MNLDQAIEKHSEWKLKFKNAIQHHEHLDSTTIARDDCCEFGKWLHGAGKVSFGALPSHHDCISLHAQFHTEAGKVAALINAAQFEAATAAIAMHTPYAEKSKRVCVAIVRLKQDAHL